MSNFESVESSAQKPATPAEAAPSPSNDHLNNAYGENGKLWGTADTGIDSELKASGLLLTVRQAASILGKSVRALERSLMGRWGNKLPEGWRACKIQGEKGEEWRIVPPAGYKLRSPLEQTNSGESADFFSAFTQDFFADMKTPPKRSLERREHDTEHATIVIDRGDEVENLLRELLSTQKALAEERRLHMEDLRMVAQLQGHMRLLESNSNETSRIKFELEQKQQELDQLKDEYNQMLALPWWKKMFAFAARKS